MLHTPQGNKPLIQIEYIHDIQCSWCPIGLRHVELAMEALKTDLEFDLKFLPFELNPDMPPEGETIEDHLRRVSGWTSEQFGTYVTKVVETARSVDLVYDYSKRTHYHNTAKAHRLVDLAEQYGKQKLTVDGLTGAHFRDGVNISNLDELVALAAKAGIDATRARTVLSAENPRPALQAKYAKVRGLNIKSTPSMLINNEIFIRGSNSAEYFKQTFEQIACNLPVQAAQ